MSVVSVHGAERNEEEVLYTMEKVNGPRSKKVEQVGNDGCEGETWCINENETAMCWRSPQWSSSFWPCFLMGERKKVHVNLCLIKDQKQQLTISLHCPELTHIYHFNYIKLSLAAFCILYSTCMFFFLYVRPHQVSLFFTTLCFRLTRKEKECKIF